MGHLDDAMMDHVNTAIAISFGLGTPQEDAAARAMMQQRASAYTAKASDAVASVATSPTPQMGASTATVGTPPLHNTTHSLHNTTEK